MNTQPNTIAQFAIAMPEAIPTLERLGIDYCCHGTQTVSDACRGAGITTDELLALIPAHPLSPERSWDNEPMSAMIRFIVGTHHNYTREAMAMLPSLAIKVREHHGGRHPELSRIEKLSHQLASDLIPHMLKEEQVLFPYINALEEASLEGKEPPMPFFGTARNPVRMMMMEHEAAGEILIEIRALTTDFMLPPEACASFHGLYTKLQELEGDLHRHIHLENNFLFPRAIDVEDHVRVSPLVGAFEHCCNHQ